MEKISNGGSLRVEGPRALAGASGAERMDIVGEFTAAMRDAGIESDDPIIPDSVLHRIHIKGQKSGTRNGAYVLHIDGIPAGWFMDYQSGIKTTWRAAGESFNSTSFDSTTRQRRQHEMQKAAQAAATLAQRTWESSDTCNEHPYLARKGVTPVSILRVSRRGNLLVPIWDASGRWLSLQAIYPDGRKQFLKGGRIAGGMCWIGDYGDDIWIAEGLATSLSIHQATGATVFVAFNCGNLQSVASGIRDCFPNRQIIIAADNDATPGNPGLKAAESAASAVGGLIAVPPQHGDWNDLLEAAA